MKYLKDYKNAKEENGQWVVPLIPVESGLHDFYEEDGTFYQDCPFCGQQNRYDEWTCNRCGAQ
jgi:hypothetical protein